LSGSESASNPGKPRNVSADNPGKRYICRDNGIVKGDTWMPLRAKAC
jgi:hypothetical protein